MLGGWVVRRVAARSAIAGLAVGLALLAFLAILATVEVTQTAERAQVFDDVNSAWTRVFTHLTTEDAAFRQYVDGAAAAESERALYRGTLAGVVGSAEGDLVWLQRNGGDAEETHVRAVRTEYAAYAVVIRQALAVDDPADLVRYSSGDAAALFTSLRERIVWNIDRKQGELTAYLEQVRHRNDNLRVGAVTIMLLDGMLCAISSIVLVGHQRQAEREARSNRHRATHDTLTGLANRRMLVELAVDSIGQARSGQDLVALLLIDLDRFKDVNDALGHQYGDRVLQRVANRLTGLSRRTDVVARLGGDEFAVLLTWVSSVEDVTTIAERIRREIQEPVVLDGLTIDFGASVGASVFPLDAQDADELLQHADIAMYVAKRGNAGVSIYNPGKDENDPASLSVLSELRRGIDRNELVLHYQPKVDSVTLRPIGVEALVRWQHPTRGLLPPVAFLPIIEATEFIEQLTDTVLHLAVEQIRDWLAQGTQLSVAVNITARSLLSASFPEHVAELLEEYGVPPHLLTLELTESALITAPAIASDALRQLRRYGVQSAIDDFGTGYSSMALLRDMPINELKIDRSFVTTMRTDERNHAIVKAMVDLGHNLNLEVVAEGVEDQETLDTLAGLGCGLIQGYFISKPLPISGMNTWLNSQGHSAPMASRIRSGS